jgi:hypothetical protein
MKRYRLPATLYLDVKAFAEKYSIPCDELEGLLLDVANVVADEVEEDVRKEIAEDRYNW